MNIFQFGIVQLLQPAYTALRAYWPLFLVIQASALALVLCYYTLETTRDILLTLAQIKETTPWFGAGLATLVSAGIAPEMLKRFRRPANIPKPGLSEMLHQLTMWFFLGVLVDQFYQFQAYLFGTDASISTVGIKLLVDQLLFTPFVSLPFVLFWALLRESDYAPLQALQKFTLSVYKARVLPLWATSLSFWPPMLCLVYALPSAIQFPLFLLANAAWSLLFVFILRRQSEGHPKLGSHSD